MDSYYISILFVKYNWVKSGHYTWKLLSGDEVITAHVGGPSDSNLWVSFSTRNDTLPLVIRDKETLEIYLAPI